MWRQLHIQWLYSILMIYLLFQVTAKTSTLHSTASSSPRALARDIVGSARPASPALSTTSTADGEGDLGSSPLVASLPPPRLPDRARALLRTPPIPSSPENLSYRTASWGSPYPDPNVGHLREDSLSSDPSDDSPIHQLEIETPSLRPPPDFSRSLAQALQPSLATASVLAKRARRPARGLTEDWIRQHTASDLPSEGALWLSDGTDEDADSFVATSRPVVVSNANIDNTEDLQTPKPSWRRAPSHPRDDWHHRRGSSIETLTQTQIDRPSSPRSATMTTTHSEALLPDGASGHSIASTQEPDTSRTTSVPGPAPEDAPAPQTPIRNAVKMPQKEPASTPRIKKRVPWKGSKNIMILIPRDDGRGLPGNAPLPLTQAEISGMFQSWKDLGYDTSGFDLHGEDEAIPGTECSLSRASWPTPEDSIRERQQGKYTVVLPDLKAWETYARELSEAKLRALGVSSGDENPPPPSISPVASTTSRQPSVQHPGQMFSPPLPTSSASSNPMYPFVQPLGRSSAVQSPGILSVASTGPFVGHPAKYNPRQSISIPAGNSPFHIPQHPSPQSWTNQAVLLQNLGRGDSPLLNLAGVMSPSSPFPPDGVPSTNSPGFNFHQRHQSLQYPMVPQHYPTWGSPALHNVREDEEEEAARKSPSKTPQATKSNPETLQAEIDEAEYHLEEQMRNQLEHEDYSPLTEDQKATVPAESVAADALEEDKTDLFPTSDSFTNTGPAPILYHPQPHTRGHSLSHKFLADASSNFAKLDATGALPSHQVDESVEMETNPSNLGTPLHNPDSADSPAQNSHQRSFSVASNPWTDSSYGASATTAPRRPSHGHKHSLSKLNVEAPEFKYNPTSSFTPGQFSFAGSTFQPSVFQATPVHYSASATSSQFSIPPGSAGKINAAASVFSPGQSEFSFSASGPRFRPDAPAFTPTHKFSESIVSPLSGSEEVVSRPGSLFGNIEIPNVPKPPRRSKAIPIVRPSSQPPRQSDEEETLQEGTDGRLTDESRVKRARGSTAYDDTIPLFAEASINDYPAISAVDSIEGDLDLEKTPQPDAVDSRSGDEDGITQADTSMSSGVTSEPVDTKATTATATSPARSSPAQQSINWAPFELQSKLDIQQFNDARPFGEDIFVRGHKKSLSVTAKPFVPGAAVYGGDAPAESQYKEPEVDDEDGTPHPRGPVPAVTTENVIQEAIQEAIGAPIHQHEPPASPSSLPPSPRATPPPAEPVVGEEALEPATSEPVSDETMPVPDDEANGDVRSEGPTFEEIDAVMWHLHDRDPTKGVNKTVDAPQWHQPSPTRPISLAAATGSPLALRHHGDTFRSDAPSPSPGQRHYVHDEYALPRTTTEPEDPFVDAPHSPDTFHGHIHRLNHSDERPASVWDGAFTDNEQEKFEQRVQFFDGRVNDVVGTILATRLDPLEQSLLSIQHSLLSMTRRNPSSRRERRSTSAELPPSDADDEDDEPVPRRSTSPRKDRRLDQVRLAVSEALAAHQRDIMSQPRTVPPPEEDQKAILQAIEDMKEQFGTSMRLDFRGEDLRDIVEEAVERRMPQPLPEQPDDQTKAKLDEMQAKMAELEQRIYQEQTRVEREIQDRRAAEELAADLERKLQSAETRVEIEIINRSAFDQRVADLEERLKNQEEQLGKEERERRAAEDRLSEVQRLLSVSSEEESRLRQVLEEKMLSIKSLEQSNSKSTMRLALLEAAQTNSSQSQSESANRMNVLEEDVRTARQEATRWRSESDRLKELARRREVDLDRAMDENKQLHKFLDTLGVQLEENERIREGWRAKFLSIQDDMARAAREVAEENARQAKKEQTLLARQDVLDAKLQAEARTRERLETEIERLESGERQGMRAVNECQRLETLLGELRDENHKLHLSAMRYKREFEEARESGVSEVARTQRAMEAELEAANNQVNVLREDLEDQVSKLRSELDQARLDVDSTKAQSEMLLEEAHSTHAAETRELRAKHQNEVDDVHTRHERALSTAVDEAQTREQLLLERLSISASKTEHLQDRVIHLEEKLEIAKEAARAAAQAAKMAGESGGGGAQRGSALSPPRATGAARQLEVPEKISPQALRESILVLQEQLQEREQRIEELEHTVDSLDAEAPTKIAKRDEEIMWLRELLAVRRGDVEDIITALSTDEFERERVKDAAIRLKANLQMEEQERERAVHGGSAVNLPVLAQSIRDAATPRVAQAVGPLAAAWGNWRRSQSSFSSLSGVLSSPAAAARQTRDSTPSKASPSGASSGLLGGLLTPPASGLRQSPTVAAEPTAFSATGRRYTGQQQQQQHTGRKMSVPSRMAEKMPMLGTPPRQHERGEPVTPPAMMRSSGYDSDARAGDFDDNDFFED